MGKKYFLLDAELENAGGDFFNSNDFKKNIFKILDNNKTPYNIAVIGKWGCGAWENPHLLTWSNLSSKISRATR